MQFSVSTPLFYKLVILVVLFFLAIFVHTYSEEKKETPVLSFTGKHDVSYVPDRAKVQFDIIRLDEEVAVAQEEVEEVNADLLDFFTSNQIDSEDIKTLGYRVYPKYEYKYNTSTRVNERTFLGYEIIVSMEVTIVDVEKTGTILSGILNNGVNDFSNLNFYLEEEELNRIDNESTALAILDAKRKAKLISKASKIRLGKIKSISINPSSYNQNNNFNRSSSAIRLAAESDESSSLQVSPGENKHQVRAVITYEVKN